MHATPSHPIEQATAVFAIELSQGVLGEGPEDGHGQEVLTDKVKVAIVIKSINALCNIED